MFYAAKTLPRTPDRIHPGGVVRKWRTCNTLRYIPGTLGLRRVTLRAGGFIIAYPSWFVGRDWIMMEKTCLP
jgi:hypothetical protein